MISCVILIIFIMIDVVVYLTECRAKRRESTKLIKAFDVIKIAEMSLLIIAMLITEKFLIFLICAISFVELLCSLGRIRGLR